MTATIEQTTAVKQRIQATSRSLHHVERAMRTLKARLLGTALPTIGDPEQPRLLRLAAVEAEALAWLTPFPHLFLPALLEEKLEAAKRYLTRQSEVRSAS